MEQRASGLPGKLPLLGIVLIIIGLLMWAEQSGVLFLEWPAIVWTIVALYGLQKLLTGFSRKRRGKVFWGTTLLLFGLFKFLTDIGVLDAWHITTVPLIFVAIGLGFFASYFVDLQEWQLIVPALFFVVLGGAIILSEMDYLNRWDVIHAVRNYWPALLILFGGALLMRSLRTVARDTPLKK